MCEDLMCFARLLYLIVHYVGKDFNLVPTCAIFMKMNDLQKYKRNHSVFEKSEYFVSQILKKEFIKMRGTFYQLEKTLTRKAFLYLDIIFMARKQNRKPKNQRYHDRKANRINR
jgi:hypothetical protein